MVCCSEVPRSFVLQGFEMYNLNGKYVQSGPLVNGLPAFLRSQAWDENPSTDRWCCYDSGHNNWKVQKEDKKGSGNGFAHTLEGRTPWGGGAWREAVPDSSERRWVKCQDTQLDSGTCLAAKTRYMGASRGHAISLIARCSRGSQRHRWTMDPV